MIPPARLLSAAHLLVAFALVAAACSSGGGDDERSASTRSDVEPTVATVASTAPPTRPPLPSSPGTVTVPSSISRPTGPTGPRSLLNINRSTWEREGPDRYTFTYGMQCEGCAPGDTGPFTVTVEDGQIVASESSSDGGSEISPPYQTIDGLFDLIDLSIDEVVRVEVTYDPTLGYPTRIVLGTERTPTDADRTYEVTAFAAG